MYKLYTKQKLSSTTMHKPNQPQPPKHRYNNPENFHYSSNNIKLHNSSDIKNIQKHYQSMENKIDIQTDRGQNIQNIEQKRVKCLCQLCSCGQHSCSKIIQQNKAKEYRSKPIDSRIKIASNTDNPEEQPDNLLQKIKKCSNILLKNSPYNYSSSYKNEFINPQLKKVQLPKSRLNSYYKKYSSSTPYNHKFNKFDDRTVYKVDYTPQINIVDYKQYMRQKKRRSQSNFQGFDNSCSERYYDSCKINGVNERILKPYVYEHHYGQQQSARVATLPDVIGTERYSHKNTNEDNKLQNSTQYKRQFGKKQETDIFKHRRRSQFNYSQGKKTPTFRIKTQNNVGY